MIIRNIRDIKPIKTHGAGTLRRALFDRDFKWKEFKGTLVLVEFVVKPGCGFPLHAHTPEEEIYYFLEGGGLMTAGTEKVRVGQGDAIYIPAGEVHEFTSDPDKSSRIIIVNFKMGYKGRLTRFKDGVEVEWKLKK